MGIITNALPGGIGLVLDIEPAELPPGAWSSVENMRFQDGAARSMGGDVMITASGEQLEWCTPATNQVGSGSAWLCASDQKAYALVGQTLTDITPLAVTVLSGQGNNWSGGALGLLTFANNTLQKPWVWMENNPATKMVELPNWPANTVCKSLRSFKQFLVALNVTKAGGTYPTMVKWSHPADPGAVPASWDEADPTKDAGEYNLSETPGELVDCVPLRDINVLYKSDSVWGMQYIGGVYIFRFYKMFGDFGMPNRNCAVEYSSGKHFVFTGTDIVVHDGNSYKSVATGKLKKLFKTITGTQLASSYVVNHPAQNEVWFCYRRASDGVYAADTALVYNHLENTWSIRDLPDYRFVAPGSVEPQEITANNWSNVAGTWDSSTLLWGEYSAIPAYKRLLGLGTLKVNWVDGADTGVEPQILERTYVGVPVRTNQPPDLSAMKFISKVWPRFKGQAGTLLKVSFGVVNSVAKTVSWKPAKSFTIGTTETLSVTLTGKMFALKIELDPTSPYKGSWSYHGMDIDVQVVGEN